MKRLVRGIPAILAIALLMAFPVVAHAEEAGAAPAVPSGRVIVADYYTADGGLTAGKTCTVTYILHNTAKSAAVSNVLVNGWVESGAPVDLVGINQVFLPRISPDGEAAFELEYYTKNVDLTAIDSYSVGLTISYIDEGTKTERTNSVSLRLPVSDSAIIAVDEADMRWQTPESSTLFRLLNSWPMQLVFLVGLFACGAGIALLLLGKLRASRLWRRQY